jgi:hypothetical protein
MKSAIVRVIRLFTVQENRVIINRWAEWPIGDFLRQVMLVRSILEYTFQPHPTALGKSYYRPGKV